MFKKLGVVLVLAILLVSGCSCKPPVGYVYEGIAGEYKYEAHNSIYGVKVDVVVKEGKIEKVKLVPDSSMTNLSNALEGTSWSEDSRQVWLNAEEDFLEAFVGLSVVEVLAIEVLVDGVGAPTSVSDEDYFVTGATQSSGRVILAIQDALKK